MIPPPPPPPHFRVSNRYHQHSYSVIPIHISRLSKHLKIHATDRNSPTSRQGIASSFLPAELQFVMSIIHLISLHWKSYFLKARDTGSCLVERRKEREGGKLLITKLLLITSNLDVAQLSSGNSISTKRSTHTPTRGPFIRA